MKYFNKIRISLLILSMMLVTFGQTTAAADQEYTYTIKLYAGNIGSLTGDGITIPEGAAMSSGGNQTVITGLKYGQKVWISPQSAAKENDGRYYVKGLRLSGRDNSEASNVPGNIDVEGDASYVIAYGISGDMVSYTVNYVDTAGNILLAADTYYGNPGERQYVSARYVDGYLPQAYNLVKTLQSNTAENVFNFVYTPVETPVDETGTATATPAGGTADAGTVDAGAPAEGAAAAAPEGGEVVPVEDEEVPQDLVDLDDEDTPLANQKLDDTERPGTRMGYMPIYTGIGAAAAAALLLTAIYLKRRRKSAVQPEDLPEILENIDIKDIEDDK